MATLKSFKGFIPYELNLGRHYINGFVFTDDNNQSYYVSSEGSKAYLVSSNVVNYYPETCFPKVKRLVLDPDEFGMTLDELIDVTELEIKQNQIVNFLSPTLADAKTRTYELGERIRIEELDEVFEVVELDIPATGNASSVALEIGSDSYFLSYDAGGYGQLYKQTGGNTLIAHTFSQDGNGNKPIGILITDGTYIYIETTQGGASGVGTLLKYNIVSGVVTKMLDFNNTIGNTANTAYTAASTKDKDIFGGFLYLSTSQGGANNLGTILKVNLTTNATTVLFDHVLQGNPSVNSNIGKGYGVAVSGSYYTFVKNVMYKVNLSTDAVTTTTLPYSTADNGTEPTTGFLDGTDIYVFSDIRAHPLKIETANADNIVDSQYSTKNRATNVAFKDGIYTYHWEFGTNAITRWEIGTTNIVNNNTDHSLIVNGIAYNGIFDPVTGILYYTTGGSTTATQNKIYKYNVSTKTSTLVYDLQTATSISTDDEYLIEIDQSATSNYYLRVRDNHTKTVTLDSLGQGLDILSTRGVTTNIPFPASASGEFWSYQYATNTTSGAALDLKALAGVKDFSDNLTLLSKTVSNSVFNGSELALEEGIYSIRINIGVAPEVAGNLIKFEVKDATAGTRVTEVMIDTNRLITARHEVTFDAILVDSTLAANGITVGSFGIDTGGIRLNVFDIRIHITKIGDNI